MGHDPSRFDRSASPEVAGTASPAPGGHACPETAIVPRAGAGGPGVGPEAETRQPRLDADCWFLSGPTASGKTDLGIELAGRLGAEIVSVDSMTVYRGLDVGTAKPTRPQRAAIRHHLLDMVSPSEPYTVARWLADAARAVADCRARGRKILFVGGTPLYLRALREGLAPLPAADPALRASLEADAARHGTAALHGRLAVVDPVAAGRIHPGDLRRIVRALEVAETTGCPLSSHFQTPRADPWFDRRLLIVDLPRGLLRRRIDERVERMFASGLVEETESALAATGLGPTAGQAAGYAEAVALLAGAIDRAEAVRRTQARTRQLAKRQLTWLRSFPHAVWITA